jgi:hypothetical protein
MRHYGRTLIAVVAAVLVLSGCSDDDPKTEASPTTAGEKTTTTDVAVTPTDYVESGDYVNGRHIGLIQSADAATHTIDIDIVQFLSGDAAIKAYREDTGDTSGTPDNDYYVRNQSKQIRHLEAIDSAVLRVQSLGEFYDASSPDKGKSVTWPTFADYWTSKHGEAVVSLFWVTLREGYVVAVEQQFVP